MLSLVIGLKLCKLKNFSFDQNRTTSQNGIKYIYRKYFRGIDFPSKMAVWFCYRTVYFVIFQRKTFLTTVKIIVKYFPFYFKMEKLFFIKENWWKMWIFLRKMWFSFFFFEKNSVFPLEVSFFFIKKKKIL